MSEKLFAKYHLNSNKIIYYVILLLLFLRYESFVNASLPEFIKIGEKSIEFIKVFINLLYPIHVKDCAEYVNKIYTVMHLMIKFEKIKRYMKVNKYSPVLFMRTNAKTRKRILNNLMCNLFKSHLKWRRDIFCILIVKHEFF